MATTDAGKPLYIVRWTDDAGTTRYYYRGYGSYSRWRGDVKRAKTYRSRHQAQQVASAYTGADVIPHPSKTKPVRTQDTDRRTAWEQGDPLHADELAAEIAIIRRLQHGEGR